MIETREGTVAEVCDVIDCLQDGLGRAADPAGRRLA
jgi:hypothetical protein